MQKLTAQDYDFANANGEELSFLGAPGSGLSDEAATAIGKEFLGICQEHGTLPDNWAIVELVKGNRKSAIAQHIDWDVEKAARQQWTARVSFLRRSILVQSVNIDAPVRQFVQHRIPVSEQVESGDEEPEEERFVSIWQPRARAISEPEARRDLIHSVLKRMYGYRNELADLMAVDDGALGKSYTARLETLVRTLDKLVTQ